MLWEGRRLGGRITRERAIVGGAILCFGGFVVWQATSYQLGSLRNMGPGYFPMILGLALCVFAVMIFVSPEPEVSDDSESPTLDQGSVGSKVRALGFVLAAMIVFAALIREAGFAPATAAATIVAGLAEPDNKVLDLVVLAFGVTVAASLIFVLALGVPVPLVNF